VSSSPVKSEALKRRLKIFQPDTVKDTLFTEQLKALEPSVFVVAAYGQILPAEILDLPEYGCINIHASLLPKYRGAAPINWAIINGEKKTGITIMLMDKGMDTGPVLLKREIKIMTEDTAGSLSEKLSKLGADSIIQVLTALSKGELKPAPQAGEVSYAPLLKKTDGLINWSLTAQELGNFIRGMNPWPGAYSFLENERIKILKAKACATGGTPGIIEKINKHEMLIGTGKDSLSVLEVQPQGKSIMSIQAFLQGRTLRQGLRFSAIPKN
jgi:methionyl-tRNA formyltransferase